jgi:hypothetical protein
MLGTQQISPESVGILLSDMSGKLADGRHPLVNHGSARKQGDGLSSALHKPDEFTVSVLVRPWLVYLSPPIEWPGYCLDFTVRLGHAGKEPQFDIVAASRIRKNLDYLSDFWAKQQLGLVEALGEGE